MMLPLRIGPAESTRPNTAGIGRKDERAKHLGFENEREPGATHSYATGGLWLPGPLLHRLEIDENCESIGHAVSPAQQHHEQVRAKKLTTSRHIPGPRSSQVI